MNRSFQYTISLFRLLLVFAFIFIGTILIMVGSNLYRDVSATMDDNTIMRTASGFITNKDREYGSKFWVEEEMLLYEMTLEGSKYRSYVYYDGLYLKEAFLPEDYEFTYGDGEIITALDGFSVEKTGKQVRVTMVQGQNQLEKRLVED